MALLAWPVAAEQEYFTWIDAQGRIHNSPKPAASKPAESSAASSSVNIREGSAVVDSVRMIPGTNISIRTEQPASIETTDFLSEDAFEAQQQQYEADNPAFFVWIDAQGTRHVQYYRKSDEVAAQAALQADEEVVYDHILATPLRNVDHEDVPCCELFQGGARHPLLADERRVLTGFRERLFTLNNHDFYQAWYVQLGPAQASGRDLLIKLRNTEQVPVLLALNAQWQPLHLIAPIMTHTVAGTWATRPYEESRLLLEDNAIQAMIVFFPHTQADNVSIDMRWNHAKAPD